MYIRTRRFSTVFKKRNQHQTRTAHPIQDSGKFLCASLQRGFNNVGRNKPPLEENGSVYLSSFFEEFFVVNETNYWRTQVFAYSYPIRPSCPGFPPLPRGWRRRPCPGAPSRHRRCASSQSTPAALLLTRCPLCCSSNQSSRRGNRPVIEREEHVNRIGQSPQSTKWRSYVLIRCVAVSTLQQKPVSRREKIPLSDMIARHTFDSILPRIVTLNIHTCLTSLRLLVSVISLLPGFM